MGHASLQLIVNAEKSKTLEFSSRSIWCLRWMTSPKVRIASCKMIVREKFQKDLRQRETTTYKHPK